MSIVMYDWEIKKKLETSYVGHFQVITDLKTRDDCGYFIEISRSNSFWIKSYDLLKLDLWSKYCMP